MKCRLFFIFSEMLFSSNAQDLLRDVKIIGFIVVINIGK